MPRSIDVVKVEVLGYTHQHVIVPLRLLPFCVYPKPWHNQTVPNRRESMHKACECAHQVVRAHFAKVGGLGREGKKMPFFLPKHNTCRTMTFEKSLDAREPEIYVVYFNRNLCMVTA